MGAPFFIISWKSEQYFQIVAFFLKAAIMPLVHSPRNLSCPNMTRHHSCFSPDDIWIQAPGKSTNPQSLSFIILQQMFKQVSLLRRFGCLLSTLPTYHYIIKYFKSSTDKLLIIPSCKAVNTNTKRKERNIEYWSQVTLSLVQIKHQKGQKNNIYTFLHRFPINDCISWWESIHSLLLQGKNEVSNQNGKHGMSSS